MQMIEDESTDYLHIIIASSNNEVSKATLNDIIRLNFVLKKLSKNYKTACISYNSKGND